MNFSSFKSEAEWLVMEMNKALGRSK